MDYILFIHLIGHYENPFNIHFVLHDSNDFKFTCDKETFKTKLISMLQDSEYEVFKTSSPDSECFLFTKKPAP